MATSAARRYADVTPEGEHSDAEGDSDANDFHAVGGVANEGPLLPPTVTTAELQRLVPHRGNYAPVPRHFATRKWYAPFLTFDRWGPRIHQSVPSGKTGHYIYRQSTYWRCLAPKPRASGETGFCGAVFHTGGVPCDRDGKTKPGELVDFDVVPPDKEWPDPNDSTIADHFRTYHSLAFRPVGRWTTPLLSFCEHPRAAASCLLYYIDIHSDARASKQTSDTRSAKLSAGLSPGRTG